MTNKMRDVDSKRLIAGWWEWTPIGVGSYKEQIYAVVAMVEPWQARAMLGHALTNRVKLESYLRDIKATMLRDEWVVAQPIMLDIDWKLMEGQHRLHSLIECGKPQVFVILAGFDPRVMEIIDRGRRRTIANVFSMHGIKNYTQAAAITRYVWLHDRGESMFMAGVGATPSPQQALEHYNSHAREIEAAIGLFDMGKLCQIVSSVTLTAAFFVRFARVDSRMAEEFAESLVSGVGLERGDPVYILRERLMRSKGSRSLRLTRKAECAYLVKAWNARMTGRNITALKWDEREDFPSIMGEPSLLGD